MPMLDPQAAATSHLNLAGLDGEGALEGHGLADAQSLNAWQEQALSKSV